MNFNKHSNLEGMHSYLSPSKHAWLRYDDEKFDTAYVASLAAYKGTQLHTLAHDLIRLGVKLPRSQKTLSMYVNDAIGYRMTPEQALFYSEFCYGTADAISFKHNLLRIADLKTGITPAHEDQLKVYAALFCLEYGFKPFEIQMELRIYQSDEVRVFVGEPDEIAHIMDRIITLDKRIRAIREEF